MKYLENLSVETPARSEATKGELRESEELYRAVVEQAAEGIFLIDADTRRGLEANAAYQNLLGYTSEEILQLTLYDLVPYSRKDMDCYVERAEAKELRQRRAAAPPQGRFARRRRG